MNETNLDTAPEDPHGEIMDEFAALKNLAHKYGTWIIASTCIALVIIAGTALYRQNASKRIVEASKALAEARNSRDIEALLENYSSTPSAPLALLKLAKTYFDAGNYDVALNRYSQFKTKFPEHEFAPVAELGEVHCIEAKSQLETALQEFEIFAAKHPDNFLKVQAIMGKARCLRELGKTKEARQVYEDLMVSDPNGRWVSMIENILDDMEKNVPAPVVEKIQETSKENPEKEPVAASDNK